MTRTKELLILAFFVSLGFFVSYNVVHSEQLNVVPMEEKCYKNEDFMKVIDEQRLVTLFNATSKNNKVVEVMMSQRRHVYIIQYDKPKDGAAVTAQQYCVIHAATETNFNESAVEFLYNLLEKSRGQKT